MFLLVEKVKALLLVLDAIQPCCGNSDSCFLGLNSIREGVMLDKSSKFSCYSNLPASNYLLKLCMQESLWLLMLVIKELVMAHQYFMWIVIL